MASSKEFKEGDLIWAKMKGFPPWPARVLGSDSSDVIPGRVKVMFFGTGDTAFMKTSDMFDYKEYRSQFEVPRKQHKDFKKAVDEVRMEAGFPVLGDSMASTSREGELPSTAHYIPGGRSRLSSSKVYKDVYLFERKRTLSDGTSGSNKSRSRASSVASMLKQLKDAAKRRKPGSESSNGSKHHRLISGISGICEKELFDNFLAPFQSELPILDGDIQLNSIMGDAASRKSGRSRASSSIFHEYFNRARHRSGGSQSERNRTRTISGMSEILEDLLDPNSKFTPEDFLNVLNTMSSGESDDEQSGTLEHPTPQKRCFECNSECQLYGVKWRCTNKPCLKWNGVNTAVESEINGSAARPQNSRFDDEELRATAGIMSPHSTRSGDDHLEKSVNLYKSTTKKLKSRKQEALTLENLDDTLPPSPDKSSIAHLPKRDRSPIKSADRDYFPHQTRSKHEIDDRKKKKDTERKIQRMSPAASPPGRPRGRPPKHTKEEKPSPAKPKTYKVEKTPPIGASGARECIFCKGQVRPQMCGGSKHRWRCVDKKCRKWYGWVRAHEIVPEVTGKRRILDDKDTTAHYKSEEPPIAENGSPYKSLGKAKKDFGLKIRLKNSMKRGMVFKIGGEAERIKRKYTRRRDLDFEGFSTKREPPSPLTDRQMSFHASAMERRSRWWTGEKRRVDVSPTREFRTGINDIAASFRIMAHSMRSAAVTRADEPGTVSGTLDLLMDSLMASLPPLFSLLQNVPKLKQEPEVLQRIWNASSIHTPIFQ
ncbi:unnamed protein product, partial [Mesorhabditis belari]|uniref:PWWP domain-containing protein n=1 Tax=Mesorhabditis belari TaxID=2138241 RepID=A0AAF3FE90_9BILA